MLPFLLADLDADLARGRPLVELVRRAVSAGAAGVDLSAGGDAQGLVLGSASGGARRRGRLASRWGPPQRRGDLRSPVSTELFAGSPKGCLFSVAVHDGEVAEAIRLAAARPGRTEDLSLRSPDLGLLADLARAGHHGGHLVHVLPGGLDDAAYERHAATLARSGLNGLRMPWQLWSRGLTTLFGKFGIACEADRARGVRHVLRARASGAERVSVVDLDHLGELEALHAAPEPGGA